MYEALFRIALFPIYERCVHHRRTQQYLREYEHSQWLPAPALHKLQLEKLNSLLDHCWKSVPFLSKFWKQHGLSARPLVAVDDLSHYPTIDKNLIRDNYDEMRSTSAPGRVLVKSTGGSTGAPFRFEYSEESYSRRNAVMWRGYRWAGSDLGRRSAYVWGSGFGGTASKWKERVYQSFFNWKFLDCFNLTESNASEYLKEIDKFGARVLVGYVGPLVVLAKKLQSTGQPPEHLRSVITAAEPLNKYQRETIANAFRVPVFNTYGCREVMLMAAECDRHQGLHVSADHLVLETVDVNNRPASGASGAIVLTDLHNYTMPFVRYRNGDLGTLSNNTCSCGRALPLLQSIEGRELDMIRTADGHILSGVFFPHLMKEFVCIREFQVEQKSLREIELRLVCEQPMSQSDRASLQEKMLAKLGGNVLLHINEVEKIPLTPSGKRRITISSIKH